MTFVLISSVLIGFCSALTLGFIHGKYSENIRQYHLTVPHKATEEGDFSSFHLPHLHDYDRNQFRKKRKRELDDPDSVHYGIMIDNQLRHVELWPNRDFIHPQAVFEHLDPTIPIHKRKIRGVHSTKMCYYLGRVRGVENSSVAISTCDGLAGSINMGNKVYYIEPAQRHSPNKKGHHLHVVFEPPNAERTRKCPVDTSIENWTKAVRARMTEEHLKGKDIFKRSEFEQLSKPMWIELFVACDKKYILFHQGRRDVEQWVLTTLSKVKAVFAEGSMTAVIAPVIVRIIYLEKEEEEIDLDIQEDVDKTLASFCKWANKFQPADESHPNHFDISMLLSMWDFCAVGDGCSTTGLAYLAEACSKNKNCGLAEDKTWMTGDTIAHEIGHLLGMDHDNQTNPCPDVDPIDQTVTIMSPLTSVDTLRWSPCSTALFREMIGVHLMDCLNDEPDFEQYELDDNLIGVLYDGTQQCQMVDRDARHYIGWCPEQSPNLDKRCASMSCDMSKDNDRCQSLTFPLADGTFCDTDKWCMKKKCVPKGTRPKAVDGGWGEWGDWTPCTRTCGRGTQFQERLCDNPRPEYPGKGCLGPTKKLRICNPQECPVDSRPFRFQVCEENVKLNNMNVPVLEGLIQEGRPCNTFCRYDRNGTVYVRSFNKALPDGAKCEIGNPLKMCLGGKCIEVGCDNKLEGSEAIMDRCGICNGDGTRCKAVNGSAVTYPKEKYQMVTVVPTDARNVRIRKVEPTPNTIGLGLPDNKTMYFNGPEYVGNFPDAYQLGTKKKNYFVYRTVKYNGSTTEEIIWDKTYEDIGVYIHNYHRENTVAWSWTEPSEVPTFEPKYKWDITEYKPCSRKCDGGTQEAILSCFEESAGRVGDNFCEKLEKPTGHEPRRCNEDPCKTEWKVGQWGRCRACKKKGGVRIREVQCIKTNPNLVGDDILLEDKECKDVKPGTVELCESYKKCGSSRRRKSVYVPGKFQETIWQQMNKMHIKKRGAIKHPHAYLKGKAPPPCTKSTTAFTWEASSVEVGKLLIDNELNNALGLNSVIETEEKVIQTNETKHESNLDGAHPNTFVVPGTTKIIESSSTHHHHHSKNTTAINSHTNSSNSSSSTSSVDAIAQCIMPSSTGPDTSKSTQENVTKI